MHITMIADPSDGADMSAHPSCDFEIVLKDERSPAAERQV